MRSLNAIKIDFLAQMSQGQMFTALVTAVNELEDPKGHSMTQHDACMLVTRWAIDEGYFSEDDPQEVEEAAEDAVSRASA